MVVQKLKLSEWFLVYQLEKIKKTAFHLPISLKLDVSEYQKNGHKIPTTALLIKIVGIWAAASPEVNKMLFRTFFGFRFLKGDEVRINVPIAIAMEDQVAITAIVIRNPHLKTIEQIQEEIKIAKSKPLSAYPITNWVYTHKNHILNRLFLKVLHSVVNRFPGFYWRKGGGCISVSSLANLSKPECQFSAYAFGPTGFTVFFKDREVSEEKIYLNLSIAADHNCYSGMEIVDLINKLMSLPKIPEGFHQQSLTQDVHI